ncbi:MAG: RbsD/FucU domain-containing protein [Gemmataceae bacterium]
MKFGLLVAAALAAATPALAQQPRQQAWQDAVVDRLQTYGHRNWIVIADSAYPAQTSPGIETIVTGADHLDVIDNVFEALSKMKHVQPAVLLDAELPFLDEKDAAGITAYRAKLKTGLAKREVQSLPHEQIIGLLDKAGEKFHVLILKTNMTLPYTSVFLQLDCGYWSADAEKRLREKMAAEKK